MKRQGRWMTKGDWETKVSSMDPRYSLRGQGRWKTKGALVSPYPRGQGLL